MSDPDASTKPKPRHPAKFSKAILQRLDTLIESPGLYLDPCAGVGTIFQLERPSIGRHFLAVEIEQPWADEHAETICGDMFVVVRDWIDRAVRVDGIVVSWVYGNRMSDHHKATDSSRRHSYTHDIRTQTGNPEYTLAENNAGLLYFWQPQYEEWHRRAYTLLAKIVNDGGKSSWFNVKNFVRDGQVVGVVGAHIKWLKQCGWDIVGLHDVITPGMRYGENYAARAKSELIIEAKKKGH